MPKKIHGYGSLSRSIFNLRTDEPDEPDEPERASQELNVMPDEPKPKLIIDEDWKTQVERERAAVKPVTGSAPAEASPSEVPAGASRGAAGEEDIPPATFPLLVTMLATQALAAMGVIHDPSQPESRPEPKIAQHFIDLLGMLETKTKGNLSAEEGALLNQTLHELRMMFVAMK